MANSNMTAEDFINSLKVTDFTIDKLTQTIKDAYNTGYANGCAYAFQVSEHKETETYYQPELYFDDGTNIDYGFPNELNSFDVFASAEECEEWLDEHGYDITNCIIHEYHDDDIEDHEYVE